MERSRKKRRDCLPFKLTSMSAVMDRFIDMIVGKDLADRRDMARYMRNVSSAEAGNKAVTSVVTEPQLESRSFIIAERQPLPQRQRSTTDTTPPHGSIRYPCLTQPNPPPLPQDYITPSGAPDLSAADIPEEQLERTYSKSCVWDPDTNPVPPMQEMEGFGRFRRSVHANIDWEINRFRSDLQALGPVAMQQLGDFEIARLKEGVMDHIRTPSCTSLATRCTSEEIIGNSRICKGFKINRTELCMKPLKDDRSAPSNTTPGTIRPLTKDEPTPKWRSRPKCKSMLRFDGDAAALAPIKEAVATQQKKKTVPLIFGSEGKEDEVIEDDEYETCEDSLALSEVEKEIVCLENAMVPPDQCEQEPELQLPRIMLPTKNHGIRPHRTLEHGVAKVHAGHRKATRLDIRKTSSRGAKALVNHVVPKEHIAPLVQTKPVLKVEAETSSEESNPLPAVFSPAHVRAVSNTSTDSQSDSILCMATPRRDAVALMKEEPGSPQSIPHSQTAAHLAVPHDLPASVVYVRSGKLLRVDGEGEMDRKSASQTAAA